MPHKRTSGIPSCLENITEQGGSASKAISRDVQASGEVEWRDGGPSSGAQGGGSVLRSLQ